MQQRVQPYAEKLEKDGAEPYTVQTAMLKLKGKLGGIKPAGLAVDLLPLFEQRTFITSWLEAFHDNFSILADSYLPDQADIKRDK